jgi:hypothetical protein
LDLKLGKVGVNASASSNMPIDFRLFRRQKCLRPLGIVDGIFDGIGHVVTQLLLVVRKERKEKK